MARKPEAGTLTRADLADVVHGEIGLSRAESASIVERILHHMCAAPRPHLPRQPDHARAGVARRLGPADRLMAGKSAQAFRTIGELADELGIPQHILRYWETRFPQLRPLQRAGNRRYYRPDDVALAKRIHRLLNQDGYTIRGVQQVLSGRSEASSTGASVAEAGPTATPAPSLASKPAWADPSRLREIRDGLAAALADSA